MLIVGFIFMLVFGFFILFFILVIVRLVQANKVQKNSPRITTYAKLIDKRNHVFNERSHYYGTFELDSGDRIELMLPYDQAGLMVIGDEGHLTFKGTEFLDLIQD